MTKELRDEFEKELQVFLKEKLAIYPHIKTNRNKIIIDNKKGTKIEINFVYLNVSCEYAISMSINSSEINKFINQITPPYPSNIANNNLVYYSYFANEKKYSSILLPRTDQGKENTYNRILEILKSIYLERAYNLIEVNNKLITNIIDNPKYYSYPFLISVYVIKHNKLSSDDINLEYLLSEKNLGFDNNKDLKISFNKKIAHNILNYNIWSNKPN